MALSPEAKMSSSVRMLEKISTRMDLMYSEAKEACKPL